MEDERTAGDLFAAKPFRRAAVLPALFARLGMPAGKGCCLDDSGMAPARLDEGERTPQSVPAGTARFYQYCALCHQTPERSPPNFLYGDANQVAASLRHCAERIFFRLSMWQQATSGRPKTPMPPMLALHGLGTTPKRWQESVELAELTRFAATMLQTKGSEKSEIGADLGKNYESLPACLPPLERQQASER